MKMIDNDDDECDHGDDGATKTMAMMFVGLMETKMMEMTTVMMMSITMAMTKVVTWITMMKR